MIKINNFKKTIFKNSCKQKNKKKKKNFKINNNNNNNMHIKQHKIKDILIVLFLIIVNHIAQLKLKPKMI